MRPPTFFLAAMLSLCVTLTHADEEAQRKQPSPEEMQKMMAATMDATMGAMVPLMGKMTEAMLEAQLKVAEKPETAEKVAAFKKNLFDALVRKGFTSAQAMQITLATAMPSATPSGK